MSLKKIGLGVSKLWDDLEPVPLDPPKKPSYTSSRTSSAPVYTNFSPDYTGTTHAGKIGIPLKTTGTGISFEEDQALNPVPLPGPRRVLNMDENSDIIPSSSYTDSTFSGVTEVIPRPKISRHPSSIPPFGMDGTDPVPLDPRDPMWAHYRGPAPLLDSNKPLGGGPAVLEPQPLEPRKVGSTMKSSPRRFDQTAVTRVLTRTSAIMPVPLPTKTNHSISRKR